MRTATYCSIISGTSRPSILLTETLELFPVEFAAENRMSVVLTIPRYKDEFATVGGEVAAEARHKRCFGAPQSGQPDH